MISKREQAGPDSLRPMLATAGTLPARDAGWAYEMKWDGIRALAFLADGVVRLRSRTGRDISHVYPELAGMAAVVDARQAVLDGEVVAFGADGWPEFEALQQRMNIASAAQARALAASVPVSYLAFDLLWRDDKPLIDQPYADRRTGLDGLGLTGGNWQAPPSFTGIAGADAQAVSLEQRLEGIVAKRVQSRYEPGRRSPSWLKIKNFLRQEVVVGGWKPGEGGRAGGIGSLLVGVYKAGQLVYSGHVGTGFTQQTLAHARGEARAAAAGHLAVRGHRAARGRQVRALGRAGAGGRDRVHALDQVRPAPRALVQGPARRQGRRGGGP